MRDLLHDAKLDGLVRQKPKRPAIPSSWRFRASQGDQVSFGAPLQRALVDPIGHRAFQRSLESPLVETFAHPLYGGRRRLEHLGDLTIDERLSRFLLARKISFACRADAEEAVETFAAEHLAKGYYRLAVDPPPEIVEEVRYGKPGRPAKGTEPEEIRYRVAKVEVERDEAAIEEELERSGRYILATNVLDGEELTDDRLLAEYKGRYTIEEGFRFLKDPLFFASSLFVKTARRVAAIAMVMGLCLLVYALGERSLREALAASGAGIRHQRGKPTQRPTLRWVFQLFQAVHLLKVDGVERISNLTEERRSILGFLLGGCRRYYLLS